MIILILYPNNFQQSNLFKSLKVIEDTVRDDHQSILQIIGAKIDFDNYNLENDSIVVVAQSNEYFSF